MTRHECPNCRYVSGSDAPVQLSGWAQAALSTILCLLLLDVFFDAYVYAFVARLVDTGQQLSDLFG